MKLTKAVIEEMVKKALNENYGYQSAGMSSMGGEEEQEELEEGEYDDVMGEAEGDTIIPPPRTMAYKGRQGVKRAIGSVGGAMGGVGKKIRGLAAGAALASGVAGGAGLTHQMATEPGETIASADLMTQPRIDAIAKQFVGMSYMMKGGKIGTVTIEQALEAAEQASKFASRKDRATYMYDTLNIVDEEGESYPDSLKENLKKMISEEVAKAFSELKG